MPMLVLIYTTLDTLAWAVFGHEVREVKRCFVALYENYRLRDSSLGCTALEPYAARCSILHSLGWESALCKERRRRTFWPHSRAHGLIEEKAKEDDPEGCPA